ncbi:hypothetical protein QVD17_09514 [Tagetes erecta]|uniref:Transmembrane protein n=1 Tax=Tagetes erecta TaxID=13708 RepID=A0AAD8P5D3_TARER|nr:hypothetical protein QVD17_09514 [Tagetes erecta]
MLSLIKRKHLLRRSIDYGECLFDLTKTERKNGKGRDIEKTGRERERGRDRYSFFCLYLFVCVCELHPPPVLCLRLSYNADQILRSFIKPQIFIPHNHNILFSLHYFIQLSFFISSIKLLFFVF